MTASGLLKASIISILLTVSFPGWADLAEPKASDSESSKKPDMARKRGLGEFAFSVGIAEGRKERWLDLRKKLAMMKGELDITYQVSHLYLDKGDLQPPIVLVGSNLYQNHKNGRATDQSEERYELLAPARFVSTQLDWYTFIVNDEDLAGNRPPEDPFFSPRNQEEEAIMAQMYKSGFSEGVNQVDMEAMARIKNLTTMVCGMYNYHILSEKNILEPPTVSKMYVPVSGNSTRLSLSNHLREVVSDSAFNLNYGTYKSLLDQPSPWGGAPKAQLVP